MVEMEIILGHAQAARNYCDELQEIVTELGYVVSVDLHSLDVGRNFTVGARFMSQPGCIPRAINGALRTKTGFLSVLKSFPWCAWDRLTWARGVLLPL